MSSDGDSSSQHGPRRSQLNVAFERLARPQVRPEIVNTPGPYNVRSEPFSDRRVLMTMKSQTQPRSNPMLEAKSCAPDVPPGSCEKAYKFTQPKSFSATFSREPRFGWAGQKQGGAASRPAARSQIDIERAWKATQPKSHAVNFNLATSTNSFPKDPLLLKGTLGPAPGYYTSESHTISYKVERSQGGAISKEPRGMKWTIHEESPGPIYNPNYSAVEGVAPAANFAQSRDTSKAAPQRDETPGPFKYADRAAAALGSLSTAKRSPSPVFSTRPSASQMPLPFDTTNFCNSGTMRMRLPGPAGEQARKEAQAKNERKRKFWNKKMSCARLRLGGPAVQPQQGLRPSSAPNPQQQPGMEVALRPATAPSCVFAQRLNQLRRNPLQSAMRIAECGYEIGAIMSAVMRAGQERGRPDTAEPGASGLVSAEPGRVAAVGV